MAQNSPDSEYTVQVFFLRLIITSKHTGLTFKISSITKVGGTEHLAQCSKSCTIQLFVYKPCGVPHTEFGVFLIIFNNFHLVVLTQGVT